MDNLLILLKSDLIRYTGQPTLLNGMKTYMRVCGFRYMFWFRIASNARTSNILLYSFPWFVLSRLKYRYGYDIPAETNISAGFYIGHFGGIVISSKAVIGKNCNISQGVTIGYNARGKKKGYPSIGDCVYIAPGAKIIGNVRIGNNVAIGANAVVVDDIPDDSVAVGNPARVISLDGSIGYILNKCK